MFTFERWNKHRNSMRYAKHLAHMFTSRVFKQVGVVSCGGAVMARCSGAGVALVGLGWGWGGVVGR